MHAAVRWLARANVALAGLFIAAFVVVAMARMRYSFALEWIEGGLLDEVRWLLAGHHLYTRPSLEYVPFIYNPLYFWVCACFAKVLGASLFTMRLVSLLASLGTMAMLYALTTLETKSAAAGVVAAGLFAATFKQSSQFMDLARVDALYGLLVVASLWAVRTRATRPGRAAGAVLLVLCFLAKQSGLFVALAIVAFVVRDEARGATTMRERLRGLPFAAVVGVGIAASVGLLQATSDGWYAFYAFKLPGAHRLAPENWRDFWTEDLMARFGLACAGAVFALIGPSSMSRRARELWAAALGGVILSAWSGRLHSGGFPNVLLPAFAILSPLFAIALHAGMSSARSPRPDAQTGLEAFVALVGLTQLALLLYDPRKLVPTPRDEAAGWRLVAALRDLPGDPFVPRDSYLTVMAGKPSHLHKQAADDVLRGKPGDVGEQLRRDITGGFSSHRWALVITDNEWFTTAVRASYDRVGEAVTDPDVFYPVAGLRLRPGWVYQPK
jgi:hypothetical protein